MTRYKILLLSVYEVLNLFSFHFTASYSFILPATRYRLFRCLSSAKPREKRCNTNIKTLLTARDWIRIRRSCRYRESGKIDFVAGPSSWKRKQTAEKLTNLIYINRRRKMCPQRPSEWGTFVRKTMAEPDKGYKEGPREITGNDWLSQLSPSALSLSGRAFVRDPGKFRERR